MVDSPNFFMPNSLQNQPSPYLRGMSEQPVDWYPWGEEAFEKARTEEKPVIVSIGYASCHWCRQMSRENYEDKYIASIMNRHFICIKVDREERPDLDLLYMEASRMFNQSAGWPLHAFCMQDGSPFWCGTYFPKEDTGQGIAPWPQVLMRIAEHFRNGRNELEENGKHALANLAHSNHSYLSESREWKNDLLIGAAKILCEAHDDENGGFSPAPKFPSPMKMDFLLTLSQAAAVLHDKSLSSRLHFCLNKTLNSLAGKGLFDPVNGGFFRYCLDPNWESPHFEKILSDNALLVSTFARGYQAFQKKTYRSVIKQTLQWIERDMGNPETGYASSLSAETGEMEGAYYLWTEVEIKEALGEEVAGKLIKNWQVFAQSPTKLFLPRQMMENLMSVNEQKNLFEKLWARRVLKTHPDRDEKRSCFQHALLVRAFIDAAIALEDLELMSKAHHLLQWMHKTFFVLPDQSIASLKYPDHSTSEFGFLEDYTFWAEALLHFATRAELGGYGSMHEWIEQAERLIESAVKHFKDSALSGYFMSKAEMVGAGPVRKKSWFDHAFPAGNSSLIRCFHLLSLLSQNKEKWRTEYQETLGAYVKLAQNSPDGIGHAMAAITEATVGVIEIDGPKKELIETAALMAALPYRPIYYRKAERLVLRINGKEVPEKVESPENLCKLLSR
jgi:uncharacterized protein YyaL (SSP411 family)